MKIFVDLDRSFCRDKVYNFWFCLLILVCWRAIIGVISWGEVHGEIF